MSRLQDKHMSVMSFGSSASVFTAGVWPTHYHTHTTPTPHPHHTHFHTHVTRVQDN